MKKLFFAMLLCFTCGYICHAQVVLKHNDDHIKYTGRVDVQPDRAMLSWSGSSIKINFKGSSVKALLQDQAGYNFYNIIVDGKLIKKIALDKTKHYYALVSDLPEGTHTLELFKLTEWVMGKTWFYEFDVDGNAEILPAPTAKKRKIEFFGNSITCGYAVLDTTGQDRGSALFEDNYKAYGAITARHFNADYHCIARSGIGLLISWFPLIMPELYDRLDPFDAQKKWNFNNYTPDVVVINLFQNDAALVTQPQLPEFKVRFGGKAPTGAEIIKAYQKFVNSIRSVYPNAHIICALGSMDASRESSPWPGYIRQAVTSLHDKKVSSLIFRYKNTPGHPSAKEQQTMANQLITFIEKNVKW